MTGPINVKIIHTGSEKWRSLGGTDHMHKYPYDCKQPREPLAVEKCLLC